MSEHNWTREGSNGSLTDASEEDRSDAEGDPACSTDQQGSTRGHTSRRGFLAGAGAASILGLVGITGVGSAASYETITLEEDEARQVTLGDGDTFTNKLIDQRADGAEFSIKATGDGWTIKNVGFLGAAAWDTFNFHMRVGCPDGGSGLIENVYANNKQDPNEPMGMVWEQPDHAGTITMRHTYVEGFGNNAGYFTNANKRDRSGGTIVYEKCYHVDNTPANFRPGGDGSLIKDCVSVIDDPDHDRAYYTNGSSDKARATWPSHTKGIRIENTSFYTNVDDVNPGAYFSLRHEDISNGSACEVTAVSCGGNLSQSDSLFEAHEGNTDLTVDDYQQGGHTVSVLGEGVPLDAEMAASGGRELPPELPGSDGGTDDGSGDDSGSTTYDHTLVIETTDDSGWMDYSLTTTGEIAKGEFANSNGDDTITENSDGTWTAEGVVGNGGKDSWKFNGEISAWNAEYDSDKYTLVLDGETVTPEELVTEHTLRIETADSTGWMDYSFTSTNEITKGQYAGSDGQDTVTDNGDGTWTASGVVGQGGTDSYHFRGAVTTWSAEFGADAYTLLLDGTEVTVDELTG